MGLSSNDTAWGRMFFLCRKVLFNTLFAVSFVGIVNVFKPKRSFLYAQVPLKTGFTVPDFRLAPRCKWDIGSSVMLRCVNWYLVTDFRENLWVPSSTDGLSRCLHKQVHTYDAQRLSRAKNIGLIMCIYVGHLESKERLRIQPAQLFNFSWWVMWCVQ